MPPKPTKSNAEIEDLVQVKNKEKQQIHIEMGTLRMESTQNEMKSHEPPVVIQRLLIPINKTIGTPSESLKEIPHCASSIRRSLNMVESNEDVDPICTVISEMVNTSTSQSFTEILWNMDEEIHDTAMTDNELTAILNRPRKEWVFESRE